jgi:plasmid stability protein
MAQLIVRNLENSVKDRLRQRARKHRRSMEDEVREILRNSVNEDETASAELGTEIAKLFQKTGLETDIAEFRGQTLKPPRFEE